jgi:hypothetical protein
VGKLTQKEKLIDCSELIITLKEPFENLGNVIIDGSSNGYF